MKYGLFPPPSIQSSFLFYCEIIKSWTITNNSKEKYSCLFFYDMSNKAKKIYKLAFLCNLSKFEVRQHGEDREDKVGNLSGFCRVLNFTKELFPLIPEGTSCLIFPSVASLSKNRL